MLDFTSALYLGLEHGWRDLPGWQRLTLGKPAALEEPPRAIEVQGQLAELTGCGRAVLAPSTLHAFWDLFDLLRQRGMSVLLDEGSYAIARWGIERAAARGMPVETFNGRDLRSLRYRVQRVRLPVVVTDGYYPGAGFPAPLARYVEWVKPRGGLVVVDDTQALGIFGRSPGPRAPFGVGGGGSLRRLGLQEDCIVLVSSLAKAFGAPVAMVAGREDLIADFERDSATRVHCSPPSAAAISAAAHALRINRLSGYVIRMRLARVVTLLRAGLSRLNLLCTRGLFPVQTLRISDRMDPAELHRRLLSLGVRTVLHHGREGNGARISFVVTALHTPKDINQALSCLADLLRCESPCKSREREDNHESEYGSRIVRSGW